VTPEERDELLAEEWLIVRHSGEIPEITLHSSLYYLSKESDGPQLSLSEEELSRLKDAAAQRYQEIILRDIDVRNFHKSIYRGVRRTVYNWERCRAFARRQTVDCSHIRETAAQRLIVFLTHGVAAAGKTLPLVFINCSVAQLYELAEELGLDSEQLPADIARFCLPE